MSKLSTDELIAIFGDLNEDDLKKEVVRYSTAIKDLKEEVKDFKRGRNESIKIMQQKIDFILEKLRDK